MYTYIPGSSFKKESKLAKKALSTASLIEAKYMPNCCSRRCNMKLSQGIIKRSRYRYWHQTSEQKTQWLYDRIAEAEKNATTGKLYMQCEAGIQVCAKTFRNLYKVNKNRYYKQLKKYQDGAIAQGFNKGRPRSDTYLKAMEWIEN